MTHLTFGLKSGKGSQLKFFLKFLQLDTGLSRLTFGGESSEKSQLMQEWLEPFLGGFHSGWFKKLQQFENL